MDGLGWVELGWIGLGWVWFGMQIFFALYDFSFINLFVKAVFCIQDMRARCSPTNQICHPLSTGSNLSGRSGQYKAQSALAVIGNIAFSSSKNKGKIINPPFTGEEFTRSPSVAQ